MHTAMDLDPD